MAMTLPEVAMYYEYAGKHPPVSWLVAAYLGVKPKVKKSDQGSMDELVAMFGSAGGKIK